LAAPGGCWPVDRETRKERNSANGGQAIAYVTREDYQRVVARLTVSTPQRDGEEDDGDEEQWSAESGVFYLIQLEPELDPGRFKVGFAASMPVPVHGPTRLRIIRDLILRTSQASGRARGSLIGAGDTRHSGQGEDLPAGGRGPP
jgi:hypothetical protein